MRRALLSFAAVATVSLALWWVLVGKERRAETPIPHPETLDEMLPASIQARIRAAGEVEAVLTGGSQSRDLASDSAFFGYPIRSAPVRLSAAQRSELDALLLDPLSYDTTPYTCTFSSNLAYRFLAAAETLDVLVCHGCVQIQYMETDSTGGGGFATPIRARLLALSRSLFPQDSVLTAQWQRDRQDSIDALRARR